MTHIEATASRVKRIITKNKNLLIDDVEYQVVNNFSQGIEFYDTEISTYEFAHKLYQLKEYDVYQNIKGKLIPAINKKIIIRDLISLAKEGQVKRFFEVREKAKTRYFVIVEILKQKIIWEFKNKKIK